MKALLIAEKPSVMRAIREVYDKYGHTDKIDFAAFHGHLMELKKPEDYNAKWKKWREEDLPIIPQPFEYYAKDKESVDRLLSKIKAGNYDYLINSCDAGREGEHIFYSFYEANKLTIPVKRYWASDNTEKSVRHALNNLLPASQFWGMKEAAKLRAQLDWLAGMNFSRSVSIKTGKLVNVGRVMSPTLKIIVDREMAIQNFTSQTFYEVKANFNSQSGEYEGVFLLSPEHKQTRFANEDEAKKVLQSITGKDTGTILSVSEKISEIKAPTLYSLLELQKDANKYFHFKADRTLAIAQKLYEDGYLSYPRTESRFISTNMIPDIPKQIAVLSAVPSLAAIVPSITPIVIDSVLKGKNYVDDAKITDHHAIIPTQKPPIFNDLNKDEQLIYELVGKRLLAIFLSPYKTSKTQVITDIGGCWFKSSGSVELDKGYSILYTTKQNGKQLPQLSKGEMVQVKGTEVAQGKTTPPERYNTASLLDAMQNAGNFVASAEQRKILKETAGLGTSATRAEILKKLEHTKMVQVKQNTYVPTDFGIQVIQTIGSRNICSPALTAEWEEKLQRLEKDEYPTDLHSEINKYIQKETTSILKETNTDLSVFDKEIIGVCPLCGKNIIEGKGYYLCANYKGENQPCKFVVPKKCMGSAISKEEMKLLLLGKTTKPKELTSKAGKVFKAAFCLQNGELKFADNDDHGKSDSKQLQGMSTYRTDSLCKCPLCGGNIYERGNAYLCENASSEKKGSCSFVFAKKIKGAVISVPDLQQLLQGNPTQTKTFRWSNGQSGSAKLKLENGKLQWIF